MKSRSSKQQLFILLTLIIAFFIVNFGFYSSRKVFIDGDGNGYYAWLPSIFIYHTIDFEEFIKRSSAADERYHQPHYFIRGGEVLINKYTCGTALLQTPLFLAALGASHLTGLGADGHEILFQYGVALSALLYLFLGLLFLKRLLRTYPLSDNVLLMLLIAVVFATNLFFYAFIQPSLSHVYSFFAVTLFAFSVRRYFTEGQSNMLLLAAFALGLVVLIRPVNIIVLLAVPFLAGKASTLLSGIKSFFTAEARGGSHGGAQRYPAPTILKAAAIFLLTVSPQLILLILQTGSPFHWLYPGEGFNLTHPHIIDFLFSYKKGWFVYTPFMLLLIPGYFILWNKSRYEFIFHLSFLLSALYFFSAWWNWFYGDGFGMRPMVDHYGIFLIPVGIFYDRLARTGKTIICGLIVLAIGLNLIQSYQYSRGIIHADSMDKSAYWYTFLKTSTRFEDQTGTDKETIYGRLAETPVVSVFQDFEREYPGWIKLQEADTGKAFSGNHHLRMDSIHPYSFGYPLATREDLTGRGDLYVSFSVRYFEEDTNAAKGAVFITDILDDRYRSLYYRNFKLKKVPDALTGQWRLAETGFRLPHLYDDADQIRFYIWNKDQGSFYLDDMEIKIFRIIQD
ncbi:MAG TPA: hypothetical protein PKI34_09370 [Bacteroidales bacterium]|nr:hypothetical protein [Bacteroidales bacterium]